MTIKEAVELYNDIEIKITEVKLTMSNIMKRDKDILNCYNVYPSEMEKIAKYLEEYIGILQNTLEQSFN